MPYCPAYKLSSYDVLPDEWQRGVMGKLVEVLIEANRMYLYNNPFTPQLYTLEGRVRYAFNFDTWKDIKAVLDDGEGDCKDLSAWRIAELRARGIPAAVDVISRTVNGKEGPLKVYHIRVRYPDPVTGEIVTEDPSRWAGMPSTGGVAPGMGI